MGTASSAVFAVPHADAMSRLVTELTTRPAAAVDPGDSRLVVQEAVAGPLAMVQSVFDSGRLVAFHACERVREGAGGGASHKRSLRLPRTRAHVARLGARLGWHGALSLDVILPGTAQDEASADPLVIDVNPRLVEPVNAWRCGVDLVGAMLALAAGEHPATQPDGQAGVRTHQLLLAVLGVAQSGAGRRGILTELAGAARHRGAYTGSTEELTPVRGDRRAGLPVAAAAIAGLLSPSTYRWFASGSVGSYAITPAAWRQLLDSAEA